MNSCVKVMIDWNFASTKKRKQGIDTGSFELIHKGKKALEIPEGRYGLNFCCEGKKVKR